MNKNIPSVQGKLRIIGGKWRSRKINFPSVYGLRPTADRIRETVFNWLSPYISGSKCMDLFAGSGALGFEALSRGASHVTFVDHSLQVIKSLKKNAAILDAQNVEFINADCPERIYSDELKNAPFDIVFLDPPFYSHLVEKTAKWLEEQHEIISRTALIYVEVEKEFSFSFLPKHWEVLRVKKTSTLIYSLFVRKEKIVTNERVRTNL